MCKMHTTFHIFLANVQCYIPEFYDLKLSVTIQQLSHLNWFFWLNKNYVGNIEQH